MKSRTMSNLILSVRRKSRLSGLGLAALVALGILTANATTRAATVAPVGSELSVGGAYGSTDIPKLLDADGSSAFGSAGYYFFNAGNVAGHAIPGTSGENMISSAPSYVSSLTPTFGAGTDSFQCGCYSPIDDPALSPGVSVANIISGVLRYRADANDDPQGPGGQVEMFSVTLGAGIPADGFRLGIMTDNNDLPNILNPPNLYVDVAGTSATLAVPPANNLQTPDYYFFDVTGASSGDVVQILVDRSPVDNTMYGGVLFDNIDPNVVNPPVSMVVVAAGSHTDIGNGYGSTDVPKGAQDADLNDAYGSDGYYFFNAGNVSGQVIRGTSGENMISLTPSYVSSAVPTFGAGTDSFQAGFYAPIDDPALIPGIAVADIPSGVLRYRAQNPDLPVADPQGPGGLVEMLSVTLGDLPANGIRVGVMTDNNDAPAALDPAAIHIELNGEMATSAVTPGAGPNADFYFFDVKSASAGDELRILVSRSPADNTMIGGVVFDTIVPEPSSLALVMLGLFSFAFGRRRRG